MCGIIPCVFSLFACPCPLLRQILGDISCLSRFGMTVAKEIFKTIHILFIDGQLVLTLHCQKVFKLICVKVSSWLFKFIG